MFKKNPKKDDLHSRAKLVALHLGIPDELFDGLLNDRHFSGKSLLYDLWYQPELITENAEVENIIKEAIRKANSVYQEQENLDGAVYFLGIGLTAAVRTSKIQIQSNLGYNSRHVWYDRLDSIDEYDGPISLELISDLEKISRHDDDFRIRESARKLKTKYKDLLQLAESGNLEVNQTVVIEEKKYQLSCEPCGVTSGFTPQKTIEAYLCPQCGSAYEVNHLAERGVIKT